MTGPARLRRLTVYSRHSCHLCEIMIDAVRAATGGEAVLEIVDVDSSADLTARYGSKVPMLLVDGREICHFRLDNEALRRALA